MRQPWAVVNTKWSSMLICAMLYRCVRTHANVLQLAACPRTHESPYMHTHRYNALAYMRDFATAAVLYLQDNQLDLQDNQDQSQMETR